MAEKMKEQDAKLHDANVSIRNIDKIMETHFHKDGGDLLHSD